MWKRIHSNRDPRDTLYSELRKEFKPWFLRSGQGIRSVLMSYPRFFFWGMIVILLASSILSFTVFHHPEKPVALISQHPDPVGDGFGKIIKATSELRQTLRLKRTVDSLSAKKQLTPADSLALNNALDRLRAIHPISK